MRRPRRPSLRRPIRPLRRRSRKPLVAAALIAGCAGGAPPPPTNVAPAPPRGVLVVSEPGPTGARLVAIDERGDRQLELVAPAAQPVRDTNAAVSPDGAWLVFASSRGRPLDETSLWIAPV